MIFTEIPTPQGAEEEEKKPEPKYRSLGTFASPLETAKVPAKLAGTKLEERAQDVTFALLKRGDQGFDLAVDLDRGKIAQALETYKGVSPDIAAKAQRIAREKRIPFDLVNGNIKEWQSWQEAQGVVKSLFETDPQGRYKYPFTANWLSNPERMAVSRDDVDALKQIEGLLIADRPIPVRMVRRITEAFKGDMASKMRALKAHHEYLGPKAEFIPNAFMPFLPPVIQGLAMAEKAAGAEGRKAVTEAFETVLDFDLLKPIPIPRADAPVSRFLEDWASNMPQIAQGIAMSYVGASPIVGAASMYGRIFGGTYKEMLDKGVEPDRAFWAAHIHASTDSLLEAEGLYAWMDMLKATGTKEIFVEIGRSMAMNALQEFLQEYTGSIAEIWGEAQKKGQTWDEQLQEFIEAAPETAKQGAYSGAISAFTVLIGGGLKLPINYVHQKALDQDLAMWDGLTKAAEQSKTLQRSPEQGAEFIETVAKQAKGRETFFVALDAINTLFQDDARQVDKFLNDLGVKDQLPEAVVSGKEIEVPIGKFFEKYSGTDLSLRLRENMRFDPRGMTAAEQAKISEEIKTELEAIKKNYDDLIIQNKLPQQFIDMRNKLIGTKEEGGFAMKPEDADAELSIFLAGATVLSRKGGETLQQWFDRVNPTLQVGGEYVGGQAQFFQEAAQPGFYSALTKATMDLKQEKGTAQQMLAMIKKAPGVKGEEIEWTGLEEWFAGRKDVTKQEIVEFLENAKVEIRPIIKSDKNKLTWDMQESTKFQQYTLPGGENYREVLMTLPVEQKLPEGWSVRNDPKYGWLVESKDGETIQGSTKDEAIANARQYLMNNRQGTGDVFTSTHFEEPNILTHLRLDDRTDTEGKKTLFIEEIQSDWHQKGRKEGYGGTKTVYRLEYKDGSGKIGIPYDTVEEAEAALKETGLSDKIKISQDTETRPTGVPNAPFKKTWPELAFKQALIMAAQGGYDQIAWTPGEVQAERYDLSKQVSVIYAWDSTAKGDIVPGPDEIGISVYSMGDQAVMEQEIIPKSKLEDYVGKEVAQKILNKQGEQDTDQPEGVLSYRGDDLKVGGEGMKGFYDKMMPSMVQGLVKKLDPAAKVGETKIDTGKELAEGWEVLDNRGEVVRTTTNVELARDEAAQAQGTYRSIGRPENIQAAWSIPITDKMRSAIMQGLPLFQTAPGTPPRGSITFADGQTLINLYKSADMSTFIHEAGHLFFSEMGKLVQSGKADKQLQEDYLKLLRFAYKGQVPPTPIVTPPEGQVAQPALPDVEAAAPALFQGNLPPDSDIDFEKIAKAFEQFVREGKAPSVELIGSFRRMRNWLSAIYRALSGLDIEIDDEIRGVFSRLLAAEEDIKAVQEYYNTRRSIEEFVEVDEQKKAELAEKREKAQESAIDKQVRKYLRAYYKTLGNKKGISKKASDEINSLPVYQAIDDAISKEGLGFGTLKFEYGIDLVKELSGRHKGLISKTGKVLLRDLAAEHGYDSEAALIAEMTQAAAKKEAIENRTKEIMEKAEADIREDLAKQEEVAGEESIHTDENLTYQIAQAETLAEKIESEGKKKIPRPKNVTAKAYKDSAEAILADKTVALATRYDLFAKAEQRYAQQVWDALKAGKDEEAYAAWQKQILNHALVLAAVKARDERGKILAQAKRLGKSKPEKVEYAFREAMLALINRYGLGTPKMLPQEPEAVNIPALLTERADIDYVPAIPDWIQNMGGPESFRDLKFSQFRELSDAIVALYKMGKKDLSMKYLSETLKARMGLEGDVTIDDVIPELISPMQKLRSRHPVDENHWFSGAQRMGRSLLSHLGMGRIWAQEMDAYEGMGPRGKTGMNEITFFRTLAYTASEEMGIWADRIAPALERNGDLLKGVRAIYNRMAADPKIGKKFTIQNLPLGVDSGIQARMVQLGRNFWNAERVMAACLNMGNEKNQKALMGGYGWDENHVQMMQAQLTASEWKTIQQIWDFVNEFYHPMDDVYFKLNGSHSPKEAARAFTVVTADGQTITLKGGYYPLMFDQALSDRSARQQEDDLLKNRTDAVFHSASTKSGFSKTRKGSTLPPKLDISVLYTHLHDVVHYITHAEAIRDLDRITRDSEWKGMVADKFGLDVYKEFREMLRYVARPQSGPITGIDRLALRWRKLASLYALGFNLKSGLRQTLSLSNGAQEIGWDWTVKGVEQLMAHPLRLFEDTNELSSYMANQRKNWDREIQEQLQSMKPFARSIEIAGRRLTAKDVQDFAFVFVTSFDKITRYAVWSGAYQKYMAENAGVPSIESRMLAAVAYADDITAKTQPSARAMDLSHWQRGEGLNRVLNMFMTFTLLYGHRTRAYFRGWHEGQITTKDYVRHIFNEQIIPIMGATAIGMGYAHLTGRADEDDEDLLKEFLYTGVSQISSGYPIIRDIPGGLRYQYFDNLIQIPAFQAAGSKHWKSIKETYDLFSGDDPLEKRAKDLAYALALSLEFESGLPAIKTYRELMKAYNTALGEE